MKYILWPFMVIIIVLSLLIAGTIKLILIPIWHFRLPTIREAFTFEGEYAFDDWSWKDLLRSIFYYDFVHKNDDEQ